MRANLRLFLVFAVPTLTVGIGACTGSETDYQLVVRRNRQILDRFTVAQLQQLPQRQIAAPQSHGAQLQNGPSVRSVLEAAGTTDVTRVRAEGCDPAQILATAELNDPVILNVTKRHTLKLTGKKLGIKRWVRDITALVVNP